MVIKSGMQYRESLQQRKPMRIYFMGQKIIDPLSHPIIKAAINSVALTYDLAKDPQYEILMTAKSVITGQKINRFCHIHQSTDDLVNKVKMQRLLGQKTGTCFQRCVGMDAINAVFIITFEIDQKHHTTYHLRFREYLKLMEQNDWIIDGCMTDPKGDRSKHPSELSDPDLYLHIIEERKNGVVIRGAKVHQTGAVNSHEHLIMPTLAMRDEDKMYTICCAVPADDPNVIYIYGRQSSDLRKLDTSESGNIDCGNPEFGGQECMVVFDNVFVPNDRIFMNGETEFCGRLVDAFAGYHRQSYGGCKVGVGDVLIGAAASIAEYNGTAKASHIKDKITEMIHLNETLYSCGIACSAAGTKQPAGNFLIDLLLANVCKQNVTRFPFEIARLLHDIAGGIFVTMPSAKDLVNPETAAIVEKYLAGVDGVSTKDRMKMLRLIENFVMGRAAVGYLTESMHGAGSPQAQRIIISRLANLEEKKKLAKDLAKIGKNEC